MKHKDKPYWADTMKQAGRDACTLVEENKKAIEVLGRMSYDAGEVGDIEMEIVAQRCPPQKKARSPAATEVQVRPYEGFFRSAHSGKPEFGEPGHPLTQKLYRRAAGFWNSMTR
jgi:hypothetical protein